MKKENENRGAALVTVLIAVTFMAILASSLIYMAYMNYLTKAMRYGATDNFYTDEFALDELATTLQQTAASKDNMTDAKNAILSAVGDRTVGSYRGYTNAAVASLITTARQDVATISVNCALENPDSSLNGNALEVTNTYITLFGVQITATTAEGYTSTITSDITVFFPNTAPGTLDINDFSVISEAPIDMTMGGSRVYSGNMLVQKKGGSDDAFVIGDGSSKFGCASLLSPQSIFDGNIVIKKGSALHITGNCIVYGKVVVESGATLIVSGTLKTTDGISEPGGSGSARLIGNINKDGQTIPRSAYLDGGVVSNQIFSPVWFYGAPTGSSSADWVETDFVKLCTANVQYHESTTVNSQTVHAYAYGAGQGGNLPASNNSLILISIPGGTTITSDNPIDCSTVLSTEPVKFLTEQGTAYMTRMPDEEYEAAKELLYYYKNAFNSEQLILPGVGDYKYRFANGNMTDYESMHGDADAIIKTVGNRDFLAIPNGHEGGGDNYLPIGYFINEDAGAILTSIFATPTGAQEPSNSMVIYENWSKD